MDGIDEAAGEDSLTVLFTDLADGHVVSSVSVPASAFREGGAGLDVFTSRVTNAMLGVALQRMARRYVQSDPVFRPWTPAERAMFGDWLGDAA